MAKYVVSTMFDDIKMYLTQVDEFKDMPLFCSRKSEAMIFTGDPQPWQEKGYDVEILPEDQVMRLVGAPQLPGFEAIQ